MEVRWSESRRLVVSYNGEALFGWLPWGQQSNITLATFDVGGKFESHFVGFLPRGKFGWFKRIRNGKAADLDF